MIYAVFYIGESARCIDQYERLAWIFIMNIRSKLIKELLEIWILALTRS